MRQFTLFRLGETPQSPSFHTSQCNCNRHPTSGSLHSHYHIGAATCHSHTGHDHASNSHMSATHNYKGQYPQPLAAVRRLCKVPLAVLEMHARHPCTRFRQGKKHLQRSPLRAVIVVDAHLTRLPSVLTRKPSVMPVVHLKKVCCKAAKGGKSQKEAMVKQVRVAAPDTPSQPVNKYLDWKAWDKAFGG